MIHIDLIRKWAQDRNLIKGATQHAQMLKLTEEVGELARGIAKQNKGMIRDALGDCFVVLTILAEQNDMDIEDCIMAAYNEIKDRKGMMVQGKFDKGSFANGEV